MDFDCLSLLQNVIQSKTAEANQHLKKLEAAKVDLALLEPYMVKEIIGIYEDQSDFITEIHKHCSAWRDQTLSLTQQNEVAALEKAISLLEGKTYHILFLIEQIKISGYRQRGDDTKAAVAL
jgi:hypothetical protein